MKLRSTTPAELKKLVARIDPKFNAVWERLPEKDQLALAAYFLPRSSKKEFLGPTRQRLIAWYCPFADQRCFPTGHRYCLNVYTGCAHGCAYCYAMSYSRSGVRPKSNFEFRLERDLVDLESFDVSPAPIHLSNSTDPFQPLEKPHRHTRLALEGILEYRHRFTTVTILTKNPLLPVQDGYLDLLKAIGSDHPGVAEFAAGGRAPLQVQVSLAFWRDEARAIYDPSAPSVEERKDGVRALREAGIPVVLRIDPLFPRSPLPLQLPKTLKDFGVPEAQTLDDLEYLVEFAREVGVRHVVYSPLKIVMPLSSTMAAVLSVYKALSAPGKPVRRGGSWRLPKEISEEHLVGPFLEICRRRGSRAKFCMQDLMEIA